MIRRLSWVALLVSLQLAPSASAQYIYLDANGDRRSDRHDQIPYRDWTTLTFWLKTDSSRDGSKPNAPAVEATSVEATLSVVNGSVEWGGFTPGERGAIARGPIHDSTAFYVSVRFAHPLGRGAHRLGSVRLRARHESPIINVVPCTWIGQPVRTAFQTQRAEYRLGPTIDFAHGDSVVRGEWFDTGGVSSVPAEPNAGPIVVRSGFLYLGWNRMQPPYELKFVQGKLCVNGLMLKPGASPAGGMPGGSRAMKWPPVPSEEGKAAYNSDVGSMAVMWTLHEVGQSDSVVASGLRQAFRLHPSVESLYVEGHTLRVKRRGEPRAIGYPADVPVRRLPGSVPDVEDRFLRQLQDIAKWLEEGDFVNVKGPGFENVTGGKSAEVLDRAIRNLQHGSPLVYADSTVLAGLAPPTHWGPIAHPEPLQRFRHGP